MSVQVEGYRNESFDSLETAVMETPRGRWFLEEYARRQRSAETLAILDILKKLENAVTPGSFLPATKPAEPAPPLKTEQLKFFRQDEDMFVAPTAAPSNLSVVKSAPPEEPKQPVESRGARLKIQRLQPSESLPVHVAPEPDKPVAAPPALEAVAKAAPLELAEPKQRVVIIRRPASEAAEIPLMEENKSEAAA